MVDIRTASESLEQSQSILEEEPTKTIADLKKETYQIRVCLSLPDAANAPQLFVDREVNGAMRTEELLMNCVSYFNQKLREKHIPYRLSDKNELYRLHIAKKNGKPKDDLPPIDKTQPLGEINFSKFAISYKEEAVVPVAITLEEEKKEEVVDQTTQPMPKMVEPRKLDIHPPVNEAEERKCCCSVL